MPQPTFHTWIDTIAVQYIQKWCKCLSLLEITTFLETEGFSKCLTTVWHPSALVSRSRYWRKSKQKVFANVWLLTAPKPPSAYTAKVSRSNRPPLTTIAHPTQTQSSPTFLFENLQINPFHWLQFGCMGSHSNTPLFAINCNLTDFSF